MRPFRERNPLPIGVAGLVTAGLVTLVAFNLQGFAEDTAYRAAFSEAAGLKPGEAVRIAGVRVGKVTGVALEGDHVKVTFTCGQHFGTDTRAEIKISTLLGAHYLALTPKGARRQSPDQEIPLSHTTAPYNVVPALQDASAQAGDIDVKQLAKSFDTLSQTMQGSSENVRRSLAGLQKISKAIASRDDELGELLKHSKNVTRLLAARSGDLAVVVKNGALLTQEIKSRQQVVSQLLVGTVALSNQITRTITENRANVTPALKNLHRVIGILQRNKNNLDKSLKVLAPFVAEASDVNGTGRWIDIYLQNLVPLPTSVRPSASSGDQRRQVRSDDNPLPTIK